METKHGWKVLNKPIELEDGRRITQVGVPCGQISVEVELGNRTTSMPVNAVPGLPERVRSGIIDCGRRLRDGGSARIVTA